MPGFFTLIDCNSAFPISTTDSPIAVTPAPGPETVIAGELVYPDPPFITLNDITPLCVFSIVHVAIAPLPPPPTILISGACVYQAPAFVNTNSLIEFNPPTLVVIATALALKPAPCLEVDIKTVGVDV